MGQALWNIRMASHPDVQTLCCDVNCIGMLLCFLQYYSMHLWVSVTTFMTESLALLRETQGSFCVEILMLLTMSKAQWKASTTMTGNDKKSKES